MQKLAIPVITIGLFLEYILKILSRGEYLMKQELYKSMLRIRMVEEEIASRYSEWKMRCPTHLSIGQEGVAAGIGMLLRDDDFVVSTHRSHAHYLGKGGDLKRMIAELYGKETGCSGGRGGSMHLIDESVGFKGSTAIVGNTMPIGVGLALSIQLNGGDQISCIYIGDGSTEEGVFYESVNFAAVRGLPVLFLCENNFYSVYSSLSVRQPKNRKIHKMVESLGIESHSGDGNNADDVCCLGKEAIDKIRQTGQPQFLEFSTYRWREHCGPNFDNDIGYRSVEEFEVWKKKDPLLFLQNMLNIDEVKNNKIKEVIKNEINDAFEFAESSAFPAKDTLYHNIYK